MDSISDSFKRMRIEAKRDVIIGKIVITVFLIEIDQQNLIY
jgi:hypothetical protein